MFTDSPCQRYCSNCIVVIALWRLGRAAWLTLNRPDRRAKDLRRDGRILPTGCSLTGPGGRSGKRPGQGRRGRDSGNESPHDGGVLRVPGAYPGGCEGLWRSTGTRVLTAMNRAMASGDMAEAVASFVQRVAALEKQNRALRETVEAQAEQSRLVLHWCTSRLLLLTRSRPRCSLLRIAEVILGILASSRSLSRSSHIGTCSLAEPADSPQRPHVMYCPSTRICNSCRNTSRGRF